MITGAGRGLGADIAREALTSAHQVIANGRRPEKVQEVLGESDNLLVARRDITNSGEAQAVVAAADERFGRIDVLINDYAERTKETKVAWQSMDGEQTGDPAKLARALIQDAVIRKVTADSRIDVVITSSKNLSYTRSGDGAADGGDGYVRAWNQWLDAGKKVIVIGDVPDRVVDIPGCIAKHTSDTDPCTAPAETFSHPRPLQSAAGRITSDAFAFVDIHNVFCDADVCHSVIGGIPAYVDPSHITAAFARSFAPLFAKLPGLRP